MAKKQLRGGRLRQPRPHGQWIDLYPGLPLEQCLRTIRDDPWFMPI
jgi:hypothetical protein